MLKGKKTVFALSSRARDIGQKVSQRFECDCSPGFLQSSGVSAILEAWIYLEQYSNDSSTKVVYIIVFIYLFFLIFIYLFIYLCIYLFIHSFNHLFIYSFIHSFIYSFIHSFTNTFIYVYTLWTKERHRLFSHARKPRSKTLKRMFQRTACCYGPTELQVPSRFHHDWRKGNVTLRRAVKVKTTYT